MKTITGDCNTFNLSSIIVFTDYHDDFVWHFSSVFYKEIVFFFFHQIRSEKSAYYIWGAYYNRGNMVNFSCSSDTGFCHARRLSPYSP